MDAFDLLGLPRRPWLESEAVRAAFHVRARALHPDAPGGNTEAFARLNAAAREVARPASRLRVLAAGADVPAAPPDFELGFAVGNFARECDAVLARHRAANGPLPRALLAGEVARVRRAALDLSAELTPHLAAAESRLRALDARWPDVSAAELAALAVAFTFLDRWAAQLEARRVELSILAP